MTAQTPSVLKTYFMTGDFPTEAQFANLIDSSVNVATTSAQSIIADVSALGKLDVTGALTSKSTLTVANSAASTLTGNLSVAGAAVFTTVSATSINFGQQALNNFATGTWTPTDNSGAGLSFTGVNGSYTRIGNLVIATCSFNYPSTANGANASIGGLPFSGGGAGKNGGTVVYSTAATLRYALMNAGGASAGTTANLYNSSGAAITNTAMSTTVVYLQFTYHI